MGRFKAKATIVRLSGDLTIAFVDSRKIVVTSRSTHHTVIFHRYGARLGDYQANWGPFRNKLLRYRHLTINRCCLLANYHGVLYISSDRPVCLNKKIVEYRF